MAKGSLRWLGHAFVEFTTAEDKVILFDPWTADDGNPGCETSLKDIERADLVLVSHDHFDHVGSAVAVCRQTGALLGGPVQTMKRLAGEGFDAEQIVNFGFGYMPGGGVDLEWARVVATQAFHASDSGVALGSIVITSDGTTLYHSGDTGIFGDMAMLGRLYPLDLAVLPIGGVFTMDAFQAAEAANLLSPQMVVPIHYRSFPIVAQSADEFSELCGQKAPQVEVRVLERGQMLELG